MGLDLSVIVATLIAQSQSSHESSKNVVKAKTYI